MGAWAEPCRLSCGKGRRGTERWVGDRGDGHGELVALPLDLFAFFFFFPLFSPPTWSSEKTLRKCARAREREIGLDRTTGGGTCGSSSLPGGNKLGTEATHPYGGGRSGEDALNLITRRWKSNVILQVRIPRRG